MAKRYYWLKLKEDFFDKKLIKKLRSVAGGDTYTIIYLKMQLKSINNEGILKYEGIEDTFADELALDIDEDVENVKMTLTYLQRYNMIEQVSTEDFLLNEVLDCIGSETESAERVRKHRELKKKEEQKTLQCNALVTKCNTDIDKDIDIDIDIDNNIVKNVSKINEYEDEFEKLWKLYPRKEGKQVAHKVYLSLRKKNEVTYEQVEKGILAYIQELKRNRTQDKFILHGSTYFNQRRWEDELPEVETKTEKQVTEEEQDFFDRFE